MKIDLHIHSRTGSDGNLPVEAIIEEASRRGIELLSITDHDSIEAQEKAISLAYEYGIQYVTGVELNVTFQPKEGKAVSLDFLGYCFDHKNRDLVDKLQVIRDHRDKRAWQIMENINSEFDKEGIRRFTSQDMEAIQSTVDGAFGRPHIADYMIEQGIVKTRNEAFDRYLVKCDVPKYPLSLPEASRLIRGAGGVIILAHPNDPNGTSLAKITNDLGGQTQIIANEMLEHIDGLECWHSRHGPETIRHFAEFAQEHGLIMTGGSDCHQKPVIMGSVPVPDYVADAICIR